LFDGPPDLECDVDLAAPLLCVLLLKSDLNTIKFVFYLNQLSFIPTYLNVACETGYLNLYLSLLTLICLIYLTRCRRREKPSLFFLCLALSILASGAIIRMSMV